MKKSLLVSSFAILITSINSIAQPILTATGINMVVGDQITVNGANYVSPGSSGASQTWNFSTMSSTGANTATYVTPSSTPYVTSFPNANVAAGMGGGYLYYKTSSAAWQHYGVVNSSGVVMSYSDPEDFVRFPFTYNNTYTDTWATTYVSGGDTYYRTGTTTVTADGYGTLISPGGTFNNVLRVHFYQDYQDSANIGGSLILNYQNDEYMWYLNGYHNPIATVWSLISDLGNYQGGSYMNKVTGINEHNGLISYTLFPNPSSENLNVNINLISNQKVEIKLYNSAGAWVEGYVTTEGFIGENVNKINVQELPEGIYFAEIILNGTPASTRRFTVSK